MFFSDLMEKIASKREREGKLVACILYAHLVFSITLEFDIVKNLKRVSSVDVGTINRC